MKSSGPALLAGAILVMAVGAIAAACGAVPPTGDQSRETAAVGTTDLQTIRPTPRPDPPPPPEPRPTVPHPGPPDTGDPAPKPPPPPK